MTSTLLNILSINRFKCIKLNIRQEKQKDFENIYKLIEIAFKTAKVAAGNEQDFAVGLRNNPDLYIPEFSLVAEINGELVGHIMFTNTYVTTIDGKRFYSLLVAPLSVALEYRSRGIGGELMQEGFRLAIEMVYKAAFLCGDPEYYKRFGFKTIKEYGIMHDSIPEPYVMGYELVADGLKGIEGKVKVE